MEKASDVYNKLKLRFVGKAEVAAKPKTENKEPENDEEKETENTGKCTRFGFTKIWILLCFLRFLVHFLWICLLAYLNLILP